MEEIIVKRNDNVNISFNKCVDLLLNYKKLRKFKDFVINWIKSLANWQLSQIGCDEIKIIVETNNSNMLGYSNGDCIVLSSNSLKVKRLKDFVSLTDTIFHEFSHIQTDKLNCKIRKNEYGKANGHYKPKYYYYGVFDLLKKFIDVETAGDLALAYYSKNENEQTANIQAKDGIVLLTSFAKQIKNYDWLDKMVAIENEHYIASNKRISQYNYKLSFHEQPLKTNLTNFQLDFANMPECEKNNEEINKALFYIARTLNHCNEADQILFKHYLAKKDVDNCLKLINLPDFINNTSNIKDLIALMEENNISLSKITNVDLSNIWRTQKEPSKLKSFYNDDIGLIL